MQPSEQKNLFAVLFGALILTVCCAGHLILVGAGGLTAVAGFLNQNKAVAATGLVALLFGVIFLAYPARKNKRK